MASSISSVAIAPIAPVPSTGPSLAASVSQAPVQSSSGPSLIVARGGNGYGIGGLRGALLNIVV